MEKAELIKELEKAGLKNGGVNSLEDLGKFIEIMGRAELLKDMKITVNSEERDERAKRINARLERIRAENPIFKFK